MLSKTCFQKEGGLGKRWKEHWPNRPRVGFKDSKNSRHYGFIQGPLLKMSKFNAFTREFISH